jgi:hypothetical protein
MIIIGILLNIVGLGAVCWALFALAGYALPFFLALTVGLYAYQSGIGPIGAIVFGFATGPFGLLAGQFVFSAVRSPAIRLFVALLFAVPAACAGYHMTLGLAHGVSSEWWREAVALLGAVVVGCTAWARVAILATPVPREGVGSGSAPPPVRPSLGSEATDGNRPAPSSQVVVRAESRSCSWPRDNRYLAGAFRSGGDTPWVDDHPEVATRLRWSGLSR